MRVFYYSLILVLASCCKEIGLYQNNYTGRYYGMRQDKSWIMFQSEKDTVFEYSFELIPGPKDSIYFKGKSPGAYQVFKPDSNGYFFIGGAPGNYLEITLRNDSCFYTQRSGGMGGYVICNIIGRKLP